MVGFLPFAFIPVPAVGPGMVVFGFGAAPPGPAPVVPTDLDATVRTAPTWDVAGGAAPAIDVTITSAPGTDIAGT